LDLPSGSIVDLVAATFPDLTASNLAGRGMHLPSDFEGDVNLVLIAFQRNQQADIDTWLEPGRRLSAEFPRLACYELPVISKMNPLFRRFIADGMRSGIPDPKARASTITLHLEKPRFRASLDLLSEDRVYALLVDRKGIVHWRADGRCTDAAEKELRDRIATNR
jgi:hypothetical protein